MGHTAEKPIYDAKATIARENYSHYKEAVQSHEKWVQRAERYDRFYVGEQWDEKDKKKLEAEGRPALTLNMILSTINAVIGEQLERKIDITYKAGRRGNENTAFALGAITKAVFNACHFDEIEEQVFADGIILDRGYFDIRMDFTKNLQGEIDITFEDPADVIPDPSASDMDPNSWNEVYIRRWQTIDQIEVNYGKEAAQRVESVAYSKQWHSVDNFEFYKSTFAGDITSVSYEGEETRRLRRVLVIERQVKALCNQLHIVDLETGHMRPVPHTISDDEAAAFADQYGYGLKKVKTRRVKKIVSCDDVLLEDDWSIYRSFTIVPYFPYFRRGKPFGVVSNLIDPQNLLNKTSSQELHIVNTTANSGWVVQEGSLVDMDQEDLEERGAETGLVLTYRRGHEKPEKIKPNQIPTGIERISQKAAITIREISAINASMVGAARADQSGKAQQMSIGRAQIQVSVVLSNLKKARRYVARKVLELIQDFYTETRYYKLVDKSMFGSSNEEEADLVINALDEDGNIINDVTLDDYEVIVGHAPAQGTQQEVELEKALRLRELNVAIPDHFLVEYAGFTKGAELVEFLKHSQGYGEPTEEEAELQSIQVEHQITTLQKEIESMDADIQLKKAQAAERMANAHSKEGYNQADIELLKLEHDREIKQKELSLRIALAARSHQNQQNLNDKRLASQIAMKTMDSLAAKREKSKTPAK